MICRNHNFWHFEVRYSVNCGVKHAVSSPKRPDCINNRAQEEEKGGEGGGGREGGGGEGKEEDKGE